MRERDQRASPKGGVGGRLVTPTCGRLARKWAIIPQFIFVIVVDIAPKSARM